MKNEFKFGELINVSMDGKSYENSRIFIASSSNGYHCVKDGYESMFNDPDPDHDYSYNYKVKIWKYARKARPNLKVDDRVIVIKDNLLSNRHFKEWDENGNIITFNHGRTSWTAKNEKDCTMWEEWKLPEDV